MWKEAKTYKKIAPHEYIVQHEQYETWKKYKKLIDEYGVDEKFTLFGHTNTYKYYYEDNYKYWRIENILNRTKNT